MSLPDTTYQNNLDEQIEYWEKLKTEIISVRENGYEDTDVIAMSETYFKLADETVSSAEIYSERVADIIRVVEILSVIDIILLVLLIIKQTIADIRIKNKNQVLEKKAYVDLQTDNMKRILLFFSLMWIYRQDYLIRVNARKRFITTSILQNLWDL